MSEAITSSIAKGAAFPLHDPSYTNHTGSCKCKAKLPNKLRPKIIWVSVSVKANLPNKLRLATHPIDTLLQARPQRLSADGNQDKDTYTTTPSKAGLAFCWLLFCNEYWCDWQCLLLDTQWYGITRFCKHEESNETVCTSCNRFEAWILSV